MLKLSSFKKIALIFLSLVVFLSFLPINVGASSQLDIHLFWGEGCPHCAKEKAFLSEYLKQKPEVTLNLYEVYYSSENALLMQNVAKAINADASGVPFLVIGNESIVGFAEGSTDVDIESRIDYCLENSCPNIVDSIIKGSSNLDDTVGTGKTADNVAEAEEKIVNLPFLGNINALDFSLPLLSIFMGFIDGFNPCAMWTLLFLISLLLGLKDRRKMWILGIAFIVASAFVYFMFMAAWLQLILFIGVILWVRLAIGLLAMTGGGYNVFGYFKSLKNDGGCEVTGGEKRQAVFAKMKNIVQQNSFWLSLGGIILLAFAVNLVELVCSAGFPAVFTQVLSINNLPTWQYYAYIILYIFLFMIDDIIVFAIAMTTLKMTGISTKYSKWSKLIGGLLMVLIGLALIFKPEWLMFG